MLYYLKCLDGDLIKYYLQEIWEKLCIFQPPLTFYDLFLYCIFSAFFLQLNFVFIKPFENCNVFIILTLKYPKTPRINSLCCIFPRLTSVENRRPHNLPCPMEKVIFCCCLLRLLFEDYKIHSKKLLCQKFEYLKNINRF